MISDRLMSLQPSATFAMAQKSAELAAQGVDVINMSVGEPDFDTPDFVKAAGKKAIDDNFTRYSPVAGFADLRRAVCERLRADHGLVYDPACIVVSNGAKQSIANVVLATVNPGDEVVIPAPYWVSYSQVVLLAGGVPVPVFAGVEAGFKPTAEQIGSAITAKTRLVILNSPSNPTGAVYSREELEAIAAVVKAHEGVMVLSDEIYEKISFCGHISSIAELPGMQDRTVVVGGVSKAYAMTGWRIGYIAAPAWLAKACTTLQGQYTSGPASMCQMAALEAFSSDQSCCERMRASFERRRDLLVGLIREVPGLECSVPDGAFYLFPRCSSFFGRRDGVENATDFVMFLLEKAHVACVAGDSFGAPDYFRMSFALSEERIAEAVSRIGRALCG